MYVLYQGPQYTLYSNTRGVCPYSNTRGVTLKIWSYETSIINPVTRIIGDAFEAGKHVDEHASCSRPARGARENSSHTEVRDRENPGWTGV